MLTAGYHVPRDSMPSYTAGPQAPFSDQETQEPGCSNSGSILLRPLADDPGILMASNSLEIASEGMGGRQMSIPMTSPGMIFLLK